MKKKVFGVLAFVAMMFMCASTNLLQLAICFIASSFFLKNAGVDILEEALKEEEDDHVDY